MTQKNETPALILSLLITSSLIGAGIWWVTQKTGLNVDRLNPLASPQASVSPSNNSQDASVSSMDWSNVQNVPSGIFNYGGSTSWAPIRLSVDSALQAARPEFRLRYLDPATGTASSTSGIRMLLEGQIQFAQSSRPITAQEQQEAQQKGFSLREIPIGLMDSRSPSILHSIFPV